MSATYRDILDAYENANRQLSMIRNQADQIGTLASDPTILRNMNNWQLEEIKRQLKNYNIHTGKWRN